MDRRNPILALAVCVLATYLLSEPCGAEDPQICVDQNTLFPETIISPGVFPSRVRVHDIAQCAGRPSLP